MPFQRFTIDDPAALAAQLAAAEQALAEAADDAGRLRCAIALGNLLTTARREREAVDVLVGVEPLARAGAPEAWGWWLLYRGTADQYLNDRAAAQARFGEALALAQAEGLRALESYVLHHQGRSWVETGDLARAREALRAALALRHALNDPRQASTLRALKALDEGRLGD